LSRESREDYTLPASTNSQTTLHPLTIIFLLVFTLSGCRSSQRSADQAALQQTADSTLGKENLIQLNETKTFALCQQEPGADHARKQYRFVVIRLKDRAIVHEGAYSMGYVKWVDDRSIEVVSGSPSSQAGGTKRIIHVNSPVE
jgi:hypothetical protein